MPRLVTRRQASALVLSLLLLVSAVAVGCGENQPSTPPSPGSSTEPVRGGELIVATLADADRLDPHVVTDAASMRVLENMYSTLLRYGQRYGDLEPDLAKSIEVTNAGTAYTITLADGAVFHSGRPVTAEDVKYSFERIIDRGVRAQHFDAVVSMTAVDERTLQIELASPSAPFRSYLAYPMNAIVDPGVVAEHDGSLDHADAGSGPFKLDDWQRDRHIKLVRHDGYHVDGLPRLDRVTFRPIPDETARTTALRTGEVHLIHEVAPKDAPILERVDGVAVASVPGTFWEYIGLNCRKPPFDDPRVRQAVALAIDRDQLNKLVKFGRATPLVGGHIPPNHWAHAVVPHHDRPDQQLYEQPQPGNAEFLLNAASAEKPLRVELIVDSSVTYQVRAAEVIKQQLKPIGFEVTVVGLESAVFFDRLGRGDFQMTVVGWMGFVDPDEWTWNLFHSQGKYNQQGYANPALDELLDRGRTTLGRAQRRAIYADALKLIATDAPMVFLYVNNQTSAWRDSVRGYHVHPAATTLSLRDTWLAQ